MMSCEASVFGGWKAAGAYVSVRAIELALALRRAGDRKVKRTLGDAVIDRAEATEALPSSPGGIAPPTPWRWRGRNQWPDTRKRGRCSDAGRAAGGQALGEHALDGVDDGDGARVELDVDAVADDLLAEIREAQGLGNEV